MRPEVISRLKANLHGRAILPEDHDYHGARRVYNGMIDKHPKMIVKCANTADVRLAVVFARENDLPVAVRGGGHYGAGLATCDDGMVIDLSQMKGVRFEPSSSTIREWHSQFMPTASEDLYGFFAFLKAQPVDPFPDHLHGKTLCGIIWCYVGRALGGKLS